MPPSPDPGGSCSEMIAPDSTLHRPPFLCHPSSDLPSKMETNFLLFSDSYPNVLRFARDISTGAPASPTVTAADLFRNCIRILIFFIFMEFLVYVLIIKYVCMYICN